LANQTAPITDAAHGHADHSDHAGHHGHPPHLAHHFDDPAQQFEAANLGMWAFLTTEVMFFGGFFAGYAVYRSTYPLAFLEGSLHLSDGIGGTLGFVNTLVLLCSSLTMVLAVHAAQTSRRKATTGFLIATIVLGSVFLGVKSFEYYEKYAHHLIPGGDFHLDPDHLLAVEQEYAEEGQIDPRQVRIFMSFYFGMTGLHALHMIIGIPIIAIIAWQAHRGRFSAEYFTPVEMIGLYWHFVDIIWVFLYPLLYLIR
jgi:cytochrome c oxidase subunit 3